MKINSYKTAAARRQFLKKNLKVSLENTAVFSLSEKQAATRNCENFIGVTQVPLGVAGPLLVQTNSGQAKRYYLPLATTEGALVASVNRGCKVIQLVGGAKVRGQKVGVTRAPLFLAASSQQAEIFQGWLRENREKLNALCRKVSGHTALLAVKTARIGRKVYARFYFDTGDAMGMNMATIAAQKIAAYVSRTQKIKCLSLSSNFESDKKPAKSHLTFGRGWKVKAEVVIPRKIVRRVLKTTPEKIDRLVTDKCLFGSLLAGSLGFNGHYANMIAALFIATGQDPAHVVEGSLGITTTEILPNGDLYFSVYLPALMIGTVGGGTSLATQKEALELLGVFGKDKVAEFSQVVAAAVLAGELSLMASLAEGSLAKAHQRLARGK